MDITKIYTDGSSRGNPGPGGWGAILKYKEHVKELSGSYRHTTNSRMELMAAVEALSQIKREGVNIEIYSDSKYVVDSVEKKWLFKWEKDNFEDRANADLWKRFVELYRKFKVKMIWVKGHSSNQDNNRCDELATSASANENKSNWLIDTNYEKL
jgi:ribonuclease HI